MDQEKKQFQLNALKWVAEMQLVNHPQMINQIKGNIFSASKYVKDAEMLIGTEQRALLIWLELSWFNKRFRKKRIVSDVRERLHQLLPSFKMRVVTDYSILEKSIENFKKANSINKGDDNEKVDYIDQSSDESSKLQSS